VTGGGGEALSTLGLQILQGLATLSRSVRIYSTDNAVFLQPLQSLLDQLNRVVQLAGRAEVEVREAEVRLNGQPLALDAGGQQALASLAPAFRDRGIRALVASSPVGLEDLRNFFLVFAGEVKEALPEDGLPGHRMQELRLRRVLEEGTASAELLRRRAATAYARAVLWAELQSRALHERRADDLAASGPRVARELVEASTAAGASELLAMLVNGEGPRALPHHLADTALIAVAFGDRLGLGRPRLRDLAAAALSSEAILVRVSPDLWMPHDLDRLAPEHQRQRAQAFAEESLRVLLTASARPLDQLRALAVAEMHEPHRPGGERLFASRVLAMASQLDALTSPAAGRPAATPEQALGAMWGPMRHRFDPELLWSFVRVMARMPLKVCPRAAGGIVD